MSAQKIREEILSRWKDDDVADLCLKIVDYLSARPPEHLRMLTFNQLTQAAGRDMFDLDVLRAVNILSSTRIAALDPKALFIDGDDDEHDVSLEELSEARISGRFVHPDTGAIVPEFEKYILPFFVPSLKFYQE